MTRNKLPSGPRNPPGDHESGLSIPTSDEDAIVQGVRRLIVQDITRSIVQDMTASAIQKLADKYEDNDRDDEASKCTTSR